MASNNDPFSTVFGPRSARPAPAPGPTPEPTDNVDAFSQAFGTRKPAAPSAAQPLPAPVVPPAGAAPVAAGSPIDYGKVFGAQGTQVKRYVTDVIAANPGMTAQEVLADPTHQQAIIQRVPQAKAIFNKGLGDLLKTQNEAGNAGLMRGGQDIGDTVTNIGMKTAAVGARGLAMAGAIPDTAANSVGNAATDWEKTTDAGRDQYDKAHPYTGNILTDPATAGRLISQVAVTAPFTGLAAKGAAGLAELVTANPLIKSMLINAGIGGAQSAAISSASDAPLSAQVSTGAGLGALFGLGSQIAIKAGKTVFDKLFGSSYSDKALTAFSDYLKNLGITADQANAVVDRMGPKATYADLDEALRTEASALASRGGDTTSTVKGVFRDRATDAPARTTQALDNILGPAPDVTQQLADIEKTAQTAAGPFYTKAKAAGITLDAQPIVDNIALQMKTSKGATTAVLQKADELLHTGGAVDSTVEQLHSARMELDAEIARLKKAPTDTSATSTAIRKLEQVRRDLDGLLKTVPDMAAGDAAFSSTMKTKDAFEYGQSIFKNATRKEDVERFAAAATPEELAMLKAGARSAINDSLENTTRGEALGVDSLFGKKSANRDKLAAIFPNEADDVLELVRSNYNQRLTEQRVLAGSHTAELTKAQKNWTHDPKDDRALNPLIAGLIGFAHGDPTMGVATGLAYKAGTAVLSKTEQRALDRGARDMARILTSDPGERGKVANALVKNALRTNLAQGTEKGLRILPRAAPGATMLLPRVVQPESFGSQNTEPRNVGRDLFAVPQSRF